MEASQHSTNAAKGAAAEREALAAMDGNPQPGSEEAGAGKEEVKGAPKPGVTELFNSIFFELVIR